MKDTAANLLEVTVINLEEGQTAVVYKNNDMPDIYLPKVEDEEQQASPAQLMAVLSIWLCSKPEKLEQLLNEMQADMSASQIIVP
jgi:hypothetical protein